MKKETGEITVGNKTFEATIVTLEPDLQKKDVTITENKTTTIEADSEYDGLKEVNVTTNVQGGIDPSQTTAQPEDVAYGKTFYAGDEIEKTGTLEEYEGATNITTNGTLATNNKIMRSDLTIAVKGEDMLQARVDQTNSCEYLFYKYRGSNVDFIKKLDTSKVTSMSHMFQDCRSSRLDLSSFDTSNVTTMSYMFYGCSYTTTLNVSNFNTSKVTSTSWMFRDCSSLTSLDLSSFDTSNVRDMSWMFSNCSKCTNIIGTLDMINATDVSNIFNVCYKLTNVTLKNIKKTLQITSTLLTLDTLINTIKELWDYSSGTTTYTLTMGSDNLAKIANTYVKLVTPTEEQIVQDPNIVNKMPCEVCESTDEGAMLLSDYATLKKWNLA